jgi:uncharacterized protein YecE (DUF72 family)
LDAWTARVDVWAAGGTPNGRTLAAKAPRRKRDVFATFDNDAKVRAPHDAQALMRRLGACVRRPRD